MPDRLRTPDELIIYGPVVSRVYLPLILKNYSPGPQPPVTPTPTRTATPSRTPTSTPTSPDEQVVGYTNVSPASSYYGIPQGFAYLASHIAAERAKNPNTLLLDAGDTFQGNAFAQYFRNSTPNPIVGGMNLLEYDVMTLGNHEFNFGPMTFATMLGQVDFPLLGANVEDDGTYGFITDNVQDYITLDVGGVDVAIIGLTNPWVPSYELPSNIEGLTFSNTNCRFKSHKCVGSRPTALAVKTRIPGHFPAPPNAIGLLPNLEKTVLEWTIGIRPRPRRRLWCRRSRLPRSRTC